jgi:hypothetical protein
MQTNYYLITNKENTAIQKTIAVNKTIRVRFLLKNDEVKETKFNYCNNFLNNLKKRYYFQEITYYQFLTCQHL